MPSPLGHPGGAPSEHPPIAMNRVSTVTDSASPFAASSALSFGGSTSSTVPPSGYTALRPDGPPAAGVNSPPPFDGYHYHQPVLPGYPSPPFAGGNNTNHFLSPPVADTTGGNFTSPPVIPEEQVSAPHAPPPPPPPSNISFQSGQSVGGGRSVSGMDPTFLQSDEQPGFHFIDTAAVDPHPGPELIRSTPDSFEPSFGLHGTRSPPSTGPRRPGTGPVINFYTDLDFPYDDNMSPIRMSSASRGVNFSQDNTTTYKIRFEQDPSGPAASQCNLGMALTQDIEICFENIDPHNIYQHRFILLCRHGRGKIYGLEICPSKTRTIRPFPLLLSMLQAHTNQVINFIGNPLLRGSLNGEPGNTKSNYDWYVSTSGWLGGAVVSSYPAALCFNDNFHRLTRKSGSHVRGLGIDEIEAADIKVQQDTRNPPLWPPAIREYILSQFLALGIHDFARMDCFSNCPPHMHPLAYPVVDPFLTTINPSGPAPPAPGYTPSVTSNRMFSAVPPPPPSFSVVSGGLSAIDNSMNDSFSTSSASASANVSTVYTATRLESDHRQRQTMIKRILDTKSLKLPKVGSERFLVWKDNLEDELRGSVWKPHGKFILKYTTTDFSDEAIARTSDDLTYVLSGCARNQDRQTYTQLLGSGGQQYLRDGRGIELFHHAVGLYSPTGIRATWDGETSWSQLKHNQSELIDSLSIRIEEAALQLQRTSGCLLPFNEFMCKLKLAQLVCYGPYGDAFESVMNKMCVTQDAEWDITETSITYQILTDKLSSHLKRTRYFTSTGLSKGKSKTSPTISANRAISYDKYGMDDYNQDESLVILRKFWAKAGSENGTTGGCPVCRSRSHSILECPALAARGLSITYLEANDSNPARRERSSQHQRRNTNTSTTPSASALAASAASEERIAALQAQLTDRDNVIDHLKSIQETPEPPSETGGGSSASANKVAVTANDGLTQYTDWTEVPAARANRSRSTVRNSSAYLNAVTGNNSSQSVSSTSRSRHLASRFPVTASHTLASARKVTATTKNVRRRLRTKIDITCYLSQTTSCFIPNSSIKQLCLDSGASHDLWNNRDDFIKYKEITNAGRYVTLADDSKIPIMGIGTIQFRIGSKVIRLNNVYHVPRLDMPLLSMRIHRRREQGCSFIADHSGCYYTFPDFQIEVDDDDDVTVPFSSCRDDATPDFSDSRSTRRGRRSRAAARRSIYLQCAIRARRAAPSRTDPTFGAPSTVSDNSSIPVVSSSSFPPIPNRYVPNSFGPKNMSYTRPQLNDLFGSRKLDYNILSHLGTGLEIPASEDPALSIGDCVNIKRGARGGKISPITTANHTIGVDIGYGDGTSPGGYKYCLILTCLSTKLTWVYGLTDLKGSTIADAFWLYAIDAGGFPKRLRTDFDKRLICGDVARLLRSHGVTIGAAPPHRQSQNGAVERQWQTACCMARSLLAKSRLPKSFWYWAIRESVGRMNMLPVQSGPDRHDAGEFVRLQVNTSNDDAYVSGSLAYLYFDRPINDDSEINNSETEINNNSTINNINDEINPNGETMETHSNNNGKILANNNNNNGSSSRETTADGVSLPSMSTNSNEPGRTITNNTNVIGSVFQSSKEPGSTTTNNTNVIESVSQSSDSLDPICRLAECPPPGAPVGEVSSPPAPSQRSQKSKRKNKKSTKQSKFERYAKQAESLATPYELFYGEKPDYRILFPFGCLGYFRKPILSSGRAISNFHSQSVPGIALGRSDFSNAMLFWNPLTSRFSTSADYKLDTEGALPNVFPGVVYDGMFVSQKLSSGTTPKEAFPPGSTVFARVHDEFFEGIVVGIPTDQVPWYNVRPIDGGDTFAVDPADISGPDDPIFPADEYKDDPTDRPLPDWINNNHKITLIFDGFARPGRLHLADNLLWEFVQRDSRGSICFRYALHDLPSTWKSRILEGTILEDWPSDFSPNVSGYKVSARDLQLKVPNSFKQSMNPHHPDHPTWKASYREEYDSLKEQNTYKIITRETYREKYSHTNIIPTMSVQVIKPDENGNPDRAKTRVVALGNHEEDIWTKSDRYAPVILNSNNRLLTSIAVGMGRKQKQGDCKNAFLQPDIPDDEIVVCRPPHGCPFSAKDELWLLQKTIYGLRRSPKHWYDHIAAAFRRLGLKPCPHDPCVFTGRIIADGPLLYVGLYVDDFTYFSSSPAVEQLFEELLGNELDVEFMGVVTWFLGSLFTWDTLPDGRLTVHISQTAKVEQLMEDHGLADSNPVHTVYRSGISIDRIKHDGVDPDDKKVLVKSFQKLVGGLNWLSLCTRPEITVATRLLSCHNIKPSQGHYDSAKYVLQWLGGTRNFGIRFTQGGDFAKTITSWVNKPKGITDSVIYTDANWGPQDASSAKPGDSITCDEVRSLLGHIITRMGGPLLWDCVREKKSSRSVCESEICSVDEGCKSGLQVRHISQDLDLDEVKKPTPLYNDNRGCCDWSYGVNISKRLRHFNIREVAVRDDVKAGDISVTHLPGRVNIADLFTKEIRDAAHFREMAFRLISPRDLGGCQSYAPKTVRSAPSITKPTPFTPLLNTEYLAPKCAPLLAIG